MGVQLDGAPGFTLDLDRVGIREPDLYADWMADQQLPLRQYADAPGELGDADLEDRSLV
jgi:hypothetical protein